VRHARSQRAPAHVEGRGRRADPECRLHIGVIPGWRNQCQGTCIMRTRREGGAVNREMQSESKTWPGVETKKS